MSSIPPRAAQKRDRFGREPARTCEVQGCDRKHYAKGFCNLHWARWRKYGTPEIPPCPPTLCACGDRAVAGGECKRCYNARYRAEHRPAATRKARYTLEDYDLVPGPLPTPCWVFQKVPTTRGYAQIQAEGRQLLAHRVSYEHHVGPITEETLDHLCKNRLCINPQHLEPCSRGENTLRGDTLSARNKAKTHCKRGHPLSGENLLIGRNKNGNPRRVCRTCRRERDEAQRAAA